MSRSPVRQSSRSRSRSPRRSRSPPRRSRSRSRSPGRNSSRGEEGKVFTGVAGRWNDRGFCFITVDGEDDIFCHFSNISDGNCLREGDTVKFERSWDDRQGKYRAANVTGGHQEERRAAPARNAGACYAFRDGNCTRGSSCRFSHEGGGDRRGGDRGYDDRRGGGYDDRRGGGHDDRRGGGYDDRRGGYDDRRGGYDDRRGGRDRY